MSGPGFTTLDLISIAAFAANYAVVAPASAVCVAIGIARRKRGAPMWLVPIAVVNVIIAGIQLALIGDMESWFLLLLLAQVVAALAVIAWVMRRRRSVAALPSPRSLPRRDSRPDAT